VKCNKIVNVWHVRRQNMKRSIDDTMTDYTMCYRILLQHCAEIGDAPTVAQCRFVCREIWTEELASIAKAKTREEFDQLYRHAYFFTRNYAPYHTTNQYDLGGTVKNIEDGEYNRYDAKILSFHASQLIVIAKDERPCDSHSYFDYLPDYDAAYMRQMIGKRIYNLMICQDSRYSEKDDDETKTFVYFFQTTDGQQFPFKMIHRSNGYYSGGIECKWRCPPSSIENVTYPPNAELIIIVGLPGSGKSTYARHHFSDIYDDEELKDLYNSYFTILAHEALLADKKICFVNAQFCATYSYKKFLAIFPPAIQERVKTIVFKNSPQQCLENHQQRLLEPLHKLRVANDITRMSRTYQPRHDAYKNVTLLDCYTDK
jgi:hypothetical protein